jgi:hypothetical protein
MNDEAQPESAPAPHRFRRRRSSTALPFQMADPRLTPNQPLQAKMQNKCKPIPTKKLQAAMPEHTRAGIQVSIGIYN